MRVAKPTLALLALAVLLGAAMLVPASRGWLMEDVWGSVRAQADPAPGLPSGYTPASLAAWAAVGFVLAYAAYALLFERWRVAPDRRFFLALAPLLVAGPLFHALLGADAFPRGAFVSYLAAEPIVYLSTAAVAVAGLAVGRSTGDAVRGLALAGVTALLPLLVLAAPAASSRGALLAIGTLAIALAATGVLALTLRRFLPHEPTPGVVAVVGGHALDGATTWFTLRDPWAWGFPAFRESNPLSERLVAISNGWPYFAIKLALPIVLLVLVRHEEGEERQHAFLLFAIFVLGYGPGFSNLLKVLLG